MVTNSWARVSQMTTPVLAKNTQFKKLRDKLSETNSNTSKRKPQLDLEEEEPNNANSTMKKLGKKGKVHPSPAPVPSITDHLTTLLPAAILALAAALSPEDKEVLAYLVSWSDSSATAAENFSGYKKSTQKGNSGDHDHAPMFECNCFRCYMSFWARWDMSPSGQLIHEILEAYEEGLCKEKRSLKKKRKGSYSRKSAVSDELKDIQGGKDEWVSPETGSFHGGGEAEDVLEAGGVGDEDGDNKVDLEKGSMRKIVSFLGEKILRFLA